MLNSAFWDSSVLIPLCLDEPTTPKCDQWRREYSQVVWWATSVEVRGAIARLRRSGMSESKTIEALNILREVRQEWDEVLPSDEVRNKAGIILDAYPLRAADSLQLAAALIW